MSLQNPIMLELVIDGDASTSFCSASQKLCYNYNWFMSVLKEGADGNPLMTFEGSNDGTSWGKLTCDGSGVELTEDLCTFTDYSSPAKYFRVCFDPNGTTTGTINVLMNLKPS